MAYLLDDRVVAYKVDGETKTKVGEAYLKWENLESNTYPYANIQFSLKIMRDKTTYTEDSVYLKYSFKGSYNNREYANQDYADFTGHQSNVYTEKVPEKYIADVYYNLDGTVTFDYDISIDLVDENGEAINWVGEYTTEVLRASTLYAELLSAPNFSDEENPAITFTIPSTYFGGTTNPYREYIASGVDAIIFVDESPLITKNIVTFSRNATSPGNNYTFEFSEAERQMLINSVTQGISKTVIFRLRTIHKSGDTSKDYYSDLTKTFTLTDAYPSATLTVEDINPDTLALTGDKNTFVKYCSDASYELIATASKSATIISKEVVCGNKVSTTETGVIPDVESNIFNFYATDSRNNGVAGTLTKGFVDYVKLTCQQKIEIDLVGAESTGAAAAIKINGNYFNGSFGLTNNSLVVQVRYTKNDGSMTDWITFSDVSISNNTYSVDFNLNDLDYAKAYVFQSRAIDKLATVETAEFTTRIKPVFDWSGSDFNFNVPVNITANELNMGGNTVIRHTGTNTVLSGNGGSLYFRPSGTDDTSNETIFYGNGSIKFGGAVDLGASFTLNGNTMDDFVIASGEEAMGSNGTWYWRKWASGKAECWGCRNFGNMAINTAFGALYRSAIFNQNLPTNLFKTTPDVINIQMLNGGNGCWIAKWNDVAPSAVVSGSFIVINATSGNITPSNISFYAAGMWQ